MVKLCKNCFNPFPKDKRISINAYKKRKFCNRSCAMQLVRIGKKPSVANRESVKRANSGSNSHLWKGGLSVNRKEYFSLKSLERYARLKKAEGSFTVQEWFDKKKVFNYKCAICKTPETEAKLTKDHIIPLTKGGSNCINNIQPLCQPCNSKKNVKILVIYNQNG